MIERESFSALPHEIIRDQRVSRDARLLYAVLQMYWWQGGECWETHATLAADLGCGVRQLQRYLAELVKAGIITERQRGHGQQKAYAPVLTRQGSRVEGVSAVVFQHDSADALAPNTTPVSEQHDRAVAFNTTPVSDRGRPVEDIERPAPPGEEVAADAAPTPPQAATDESKKPRRPRRSREDEGTLAPDAIELTDQSYETALKWGFTRENVAFQLERFLSKARAKGWRYLDWKEAFRNWLLNEVSYAKRDGRPISGPPPSANGTPASSAPVRMKVY